MGAAWTIARKDLRQRLRDRSAYIIGIVAPLGLALVFGFVLNPLADFEFDATYAVVDLDGGPVSRLFVDNVLGGAEGIEVVEVASVAEAEALVDTEVNPLGGPGEGDTADAAIIFPAGFSADVQSERPVTIEVIGNQGSDTNAGIAVALAEGYASELTSVRVAVATVENLLGGEVDRLAAGVEVLQTPNPVTLRDDTAATKQLDGITFYAAGMAIFFLFFTVQSGITSLLEERRTGTLARLISSPITRSSILAGKMLSSFVVGLVSMVVLFVATTFAVDADWGPPIGVALLILAAIIAALGIVAFLAGFARSSEQAAAAGSMVGMVLGFLGGTFFDVSQAGGVLGSLRFISPHGWFMQGLADLRSDDLSVVVVPVLAMVTFGVVAGTIGVARLRKGLRP
ncbi:MAG: ABC transporter permease [Acidimicrobiia bacterium]|nr:ABC transporter permease [Acidimicrobiia bacterium]